MSDKMLERARDMLYTLAPSTRERDSFVKHHELWLAEQFREVEQEAAQEHDTECPCYGDQVAHSYSCMDCTCEVGADFQEWVAQAKRAEAKLREVVRAGDALVDPSTRMQRLCSKGETICFANEWDEQDGERYAALLAAWDAATKGISRD